MIAFSFLNRIKAHCPTAGKGLIALLLAVLLNACGTYTPSRDLIKDSGPKGPVDVSHVPDAVPRVEPRTKAGNTSPYTVLGKTYRVLEKSRGFRQRGMASWYGNKFHGRRTANGEIYNMYGMTAAHKTLPIPSYVRVTNINNGRQVIVRVNDRGPFHDNRIIDLTYSAAAKLGFIKQGTAPVTVEVVEPGAVAAVTDTAAVSASAPGAVKAPAPATVDGFQLPDNTYLQAGAFGSRQAAEAQQQRIATVTQFPVLVQSGNGDLYRVRIGPIRDNLRLVQLRELLQEKQLAVPHVVYD